MSEQLHNGFQNLDDFLRNSLNNHQAELSPNLWGKMKLKLLKNDVSEFVRFKKFKQAFHPQCKSVTLQLKIWSSYAAAACLMVGIVYGSSYYVSTIINGPEQKTEKEIAPTQIKTLKPEIKAEQQAPEISSLPVISNNQDKKPVNQNVVIAVDNNSPVKSKIQENTTINNSRQETTKPVESKNFNTLINYIQRLNPQDKIAVADKVEQTAESGESTDNIDFNVTENTQENSIETPVYQLEIPNIITPNGDGFNDVLIIKNLDKYTDNNLLIADRAGKLVYEKNSYQNDWDAQNAPDGTYYYVISYKDKNNSKGVIKGLITILRK